MTNSGGEGVLFVPGDRNDMVVLNWYGTPQEKLELYAEAFHRAGLQLAAAYDGVIVRDIAACPVVYLYRHAFELYLKAILIPGEQLRGLRRRPSLCLETCINGHRLPDLATKFLMVVEDMGWGEDMGVDGFRTRQDFLALVNEWDAFDQQSFSFRYPMDKKGNASLPERFIFSLRLFCQRMDALLEVLDGSVTAVEQAFESEAEARSYDDY